MTVSFVHGLLRLTVHAFSDFRHDFSHCTLLFLFGIYFFFSYSDPSSLTGITMQRFKLSPIACMKISLLRS